MIHFCTYCDRGYAARLLCLHDSLVAQAEEFELSVLCFDDDTRSVIEAVNASSLRAIPLGDLLEADPEFAAVRARRTPVEFFFTATPVLVRYCLNAQPGAERMIYLDADLYFFGPVADVLNLQGDASVGIVSHRFPPRLAARNVYGTYNVAWVSFSRDENGLACLAWWRERCLEWCHDFVDGGRFADQGYLDQFAKRFGGVRVLDHPGIDAAPWNIAEAVLGQSGGRITLNGQPLLFFHFQGLREVARGWFEPGLRAYRTPLTAALRNLVYAPYVDRLAVAQRVVAGVETARAEVRHDRLNRSRSWRDRWERAKRKWLLPYYGRVTGRLIHAAAGRMRRN